MSDDARYQFLKDIYFGADFSWRDGEEIEHSMLLFKMPEGMRMSGDLDRSIDEEIARHAQGSAHEKW